MGSVYGAVNALPKEAEPFADLLSSNEIQSELAEEGTIKVVNSPPMIKEVGDHSSTSAPTQNGKEVGDHLGINQIKLELAASGFFRENLAEAPDVIVILIVKYMKWFKMWTPIWPTTEAIWEDDSLKGFLDGRITASGGATGTISSYHWRNAGGTVTSVNTLPVSKDNIGNLYGDTVTWTVSFHRRMDWNQEFGVTQRPRTRSGRSQWDQGSGVTIAIDGNGRSYNQYKYNHIWRSMHKDIEEESEREEEYEEDSDEDCEEGLNIDCHWYQPEEIPRLSTWNGKPVDAWNMPPAKIETYRFEWNIEQQTMTIYDPNGEKMGPNDKPYTWWLSGIDTYNGSPYNQWHLWAKCKIGWKTKLEYAFTDPNTL